MEDFVMNNEETDAVQADVEYVQTDPIPPFPEQQKTTPDFNMQDAVISAEEEIKNELVPQSAANKLIGEAHKQAIIATIQNKEEVRDQVLKQAENSISSELKAIDQDNAARIQTATYNANKEACSNYGINSNVPVWQITLMKIGSAFWFFIYWIFATIIICPINVFCKGLKAFIKQSWLVLVTGIFIYLLVTIGIPFLTLWIADHELLLSLLGI